MSASVAAHVIDGTSGGDENGVEGSLLDLLYAGPPAWMKDALCRDHPEVTFFPDLGQSARPAKRVCDDCLVKRQCREWSLEQGPELDGVWAGMSQLERRAVRPDRPRPTREPARCGGCGRVELVLRRGLCPRCSMAAYRRQRASSRWRTRRESPRVATGRETL